MFRPNARTFITLLLQQTGLDRKMNAPWFLSGGIAESSCVGAYRAIGVATLQKSLVNLITPGTHDLTSTSAPMLSTLAGWIFDGSTQYLDTGIIPNQNFSFLICFKDVTNTGTVFGEHKSGKAFAFAPSNPIKKDDFACCYWFANQKVQSSPPCMQSGVVGMAGNYRYKNGLPDGQFVTDTFTSNRPFLIGAAMLNSDKPGNFCACSVRNVAIYNVVLTPEQMAQISALMLLQD